jgi:hypothetical protein
MSFLSAPNPLKLYGSFPQFPIPSRSITCSPSFAVYTPSSRIILGSTFSRTSLIRQALGSIMLLSCLICRQRGTVEVVVGTIKVWRIMYRVGYHARGLYLAILGLGGYNLFDLCKLTSKISFLHSELLPLPFLRRSGGINLYPARVVS